MSISVPARKHLWGRSGNLCAEPSCKQLLTAETGDTAATAVLLEEGIVIGQEAHIRSGKEDGPRYKQGYAGVDDYKNLILLCPTHHTMIDKAVSQWPVKRVRQMKRDHEAAIFSRLSKKERIDKEITEAVSLAVAHVDDVLCGAWNQGMTMRLNSPRPSISEKNYDEFIDLSRWLLAKTWPQVFPKIGAAMGKLQEVLRELLWLLDDFDAQSEGNLVLDRAYARESKFERRNALLQAFMVQAAVIRAFVEDMCRAANLVAHAVRLELDPLYRFHEGALLNQLHNGATTRLEYENIDWDSLPAVEDAAEVRAKEELQRARIATSEVTR